MWVKYLVVIFLFYLFAILQNSFFVHFSLFGAAPNLVFALFFALIFLAAKGPPASGWTIIFYSVTAGLFLDAFSYLHFGVSIISLLVIAFACKKIQNLLQEKKGNNFPFVYFLPLFFIALLVYDLVIKNFNFRVNFLAEIIYNLASACVIFYVYKKFFRSGEDDRQLKLFGA